MNLTNDVISKCYNVSKGYKDSEEDNETWLETFSDMNYFIGTHFSIGTHFWQVVKNNFEFFRFYLFKFVFVTLVEVRKICFFECMTLIMEYFCWNLVAFKN